MHGTTYLPRHVGLIPDGARRWARHFHQTYHFAYSQVMCNVVEFTRTMFDHQVQSASIYLLSKDNLQRPPEELQPVFETECHLVKTLLPPLAERYKARVIHAGCLSLLPPCFARAIETLCTNTQHYTERTIYLLIAYDPQDELQHAYTQWDQQSPIYSHLWVPEYLDLVIRSSGEYRLSNFLPLQSGYAEYIFLDKHSVDISAQDITNCLEQYAARQRRFGG
jgi:undecaprenyl diphosphate synthase